MVERKKINIIGAGFAGLSAGCYLQINGYDTEIFELHDKPGGLCTAWKRKGYTIDGCVHWLMGSNPGNPFYNLWNEIIDMQSIEFVHHETRWDIEVKDYKDKHGDNVLHLYTDLNRLEEYFKEIAPEDTLVIDEFIKSVRDQQKWDLPPLIEKAPEVRSFFYKLRMLKLLPALFYVKKWAKVSIEEMANRFQNPFIREAMKIGSMGLDYSILAFTMQLANFDKKTCGYPIGGSMTLSNALAEKYLSLGGKIHYKSPVKTILVQDDKATGIRLENGTEFASDLVISAADGKFTIFSALDGKYVDDELLNLYNNQEPYKRFNSAVLVSLGVAKTFENTPPHLVVKLDKPLKLPDGTEISYIEIHVYNYDPTLAPSGKTNIAVSLITHEFDYWQNLREESSDQYKAEKNEIAERVVDILETKLGPIREKVEVMDVATPATFHRYTNNWNGSIQGWMPPDDFLAGEPLKKELPGLGNFYMIGQWIVPGGGLPIAFLDGRNVAQIICKRDKKKFTTRGNVA